MPAMDRGKQLTAAGVALLLLATVVVVVGSPFGGTGEYAWTTVTIEDEDGSRLATVDVRIANTSAKRYTGLSNTSSLPDGEGMLFVHEREDEYTYAFHMEGMAFPLDIVFVDANGTITTIHHAPVPEEIPGGDGRFPGRGMYVLEVPRGYTNATGVEVGDRVVIPADVTA